MTEAYGAVMRSPFRAAPGGNHERLLRGERFIHIPDVRSGSDVARRVPSGEHPVHADDQSIRVSRQMEEARRGPSRRCEADHADPVIRLAEMLGPAMVSGIE